MFKNLLLHFENDLKALSTGKRDLVFSFNGGVLNRYVEVEGKKG